MSLDMDLLLHLMKTDISVAFLHLRVKLLPIPFYLFPYYLVSPAANPLKLSDHSRLYVREG